MIKKMRKFNLEVEYDEDLEMSDYDVKDLVYEALLDYGFQSVAVWKDEETTSETGTVPNI